MEQIYDFMGYTSTKFLFIAFLLMYVGSFLTTEYHRGSNAICLGAKFVIERNIEIEYNLRKSGDIEGANKLHKSLVALANRADDCEFNLLKILKRRRHK